MASSWIQESFHALKLTGLDKRVDRWLKYLRSEIAGITERALVSTCGPFRDLLIYLKRGWLRWQRKWSTRKVWYAFKSWINTHVYCGHQHSRKKLRIVTCVCAFWFTATLYLLVFILQLLHSVQSFASCAIRAFILHNGRQRSSGYRLKTVESWARTAPVLWGRYNGSINFSNNHLIRLLD